VLKATTAVGCFATERRAEEIGPAHAVSLQEARDQARLCRKLLLDGIDPIAAKRARVAAAKSATASTQTFEQCAEACFDSHKQVWKNAKHRREWLASLAKFVHPAIGALPVAAIDTAMVLRVLGPIWTTLPETATRVRSRVEKVLDWARARGYRSGDNPARWKGHLDHLLPAQPRAKRVLAPASGVTWARLALANRVAARGTISSEIGSVTRLRVLTLS